MAGYHFGDIPGIKEGDVFVDRKALGEAGIHRALVAGIDGNPKVGASSIVMNGGYVDDYDEGDEILYTGHGGNDPNSGRQIADQSWDSPGNKALVVSEIQNLPVRVTRGYKHKSPFSPKVGYQYAGLYFVTEYFEEVGKNGFRICRFRLNKAFPSNPYSLVHRTDIGIIENQRVETTVKRLLRDTKIVTDIKKMYDYSCQICELRIEVRGIPYAEGCHIKPLGRPHNGADSLDNVLCLCPNHHVMFDKGVFGIGDDFRLMGLDGRLRISQDHPINLVNVEYHREHIFINK